jgi:predicted dehydrogenase
VTASRISQKRERKLRIFSKDSYISADFQEKILSINKKGKTNNEAGFKDIDHQEIRYDDTDALNLEVLDFIRAIKTNGQPTVSGMDGRRALQTAIEITSLILPI